MMGLLYVDNLDLFVKYAFENASGSYPFYLFMHAYDVDTFATMKESLYKMYASMYSSKVSIRSFDMSLV